MGIDPLTHQPISTETDQLQHQHQQEQEQEQEQEQKQQPTSLTDDTSLQSPSAPEAKEEEKSMRSPFDPLELMNGFCTDEVPLVEPSEILVPCAPSSSTSSSSSSSSNSSNLFQDLQFLDFEWPCDYNSHNNTALWDDDFSSWDLLINDDDVHDDRKQITVDPSLIQCPRMVLDQESWVHSLLWLNREYPCGLILDVRFHRELNKSRSGKIPSLNLAFSFFSFTIFKGT